MPTYRYKARDVEGKALEGRLEADNIRSLGEKLSEIGITLVDAKEAKRAESTAFYFGKVKRREIILFTNHLAISVEAGIPITQAIADYGRETDNPRVKNIIQDIERQVMAGVSLSEALSQHPDAFSELYTSIVATGEATGKLDLVLRDLTGFLEWQENIVAQVRQASIYPAILILMIIGVIAIMMTVTLPKFIPVLKSFNVELPVPTKILIAVSEFFQKFWWALLLGGVGAVAAYKITNRSFKGRYFWDSVKIKLPILGKLQHKIILSKFAHYFSILYSSGIGIIESFGIIERVVGNEPMRAAVLRARDAIERGETIYEALKKENLFPPLVLRMIQVGESTGKLDVSLQKASSYYDNEVPAAIKKMFAVFEPMLVIVMGVVVLFIALAIFLPLYKLTSTIGSQK